ncbi:MAG: hypothetical protein V3U27_12340 [Candidatus Tectomicrobia bacterium]
MRVHRCLGIVAACEPEATLVRRQLQVHDKKVSAAGTLWRGRLLDQEVALLRCGMGARRATSAVTWLTQHCCLWGVMSLGFAGGLQRHVATGDAVLAARVGSVSTDHMTSQNTEVIEPDRTLARLAAAAAAQAALVGHRGMLLSAIALVPRAVDKQWLGQQSGALAVDMESYSIGRVAAVQRLPFVVLRTIFDTIAEDLLVPADACITPDGLLQPGRLTGYLARHPRLFLQVPRLWSQFRRAGKHLEVWLHHFLTMLSQQS